MATIQPQGSRAGIITWLVVFVILTLTASIFAIYFNVEYRKATLDNQTMKLKYGDIVVDSDLSSNEIQELKAAGKDASSPYTGLKATAVAIAQGKDLAKMITGMTISSGNAARDASEQARATLDSVQKSIGASVKLPSTTDNLNAALNTLATTITARDAQIADLENQLKGAKDSAKATETRAASTVAGREKQIEEIRTGATQTLTQAQEDRNAKQAQIESFEKDRETERNAAKDAVNKLQLSIAEKDRQVKDLQSEINRLQQKLAGRRADVTAPITRASDGNIIRVASTTNVFINLGAGDQIVPGLTFQIYDKSEGVPALGDGMRDEDMPAGKGSIEVINVGATSSLCRVIKNTPGTTISEGDLIANLIYDVNTKYNFLVHGNFDLDQDGRASAADTEVVKRLIVQWGGKMTDKISTETDFVVLGKEPVVPAFTKEELQDPVIAARFEKLRKEFDDYQAVREAARELHIPIMNQNRFLYYIGYYEMARK